MNMWELKLLKYNLVKNTMKKLKILMKIYEKNRTISR
jgi:hypothetical protein